MAGNAPKKATLILSIVIVALAIALVLVKGFSIAVLSANAFWVAIVGYAVLLLGNLLKGF